ncbi:MAG: NAD(P)-dependent oxidoreductase [Deltaproteobacteria bacterium]|nr:NAD(P)-dependent oxidoreductase [Deltaproteobacteria bacterium]
MRVAVTGASGFIGTALVQALAERGDEVVGTDRYAPATPLPVRAFVTADLGDGHALARAFEGAEVVFHLAALPAIARAPDATYAATNVEGTERVLRLARRAGARKVVHLSSSTVYGRPEIPSIPEDHPLSPACAYSRSKAAAEELCLRQADDGYDVSIIRPRVVVGAGRAGIFATFFAMMELGLPLPLPAGGDFRFQFTAVDDLVRALERVAERGRPGRIYNVGSAVERTLREDLAELFRRAGSRSFVVPVPAGAATAAFAVLHRLGVGPLVPEQYRVASRQFVLDTSRARAELDFVAERANIDGVVDAWRWWREHRDEAAWRSLVRWWRPRHQNALQRRSG